jgi:thymidylate synthase (FAD)
VSFVPLRVTLVAQTQLILDTEKVNEHGHNILDYALEEWLPFNDDEDNASSSADKLHEFAGRGCYDAWARANAATRTNGAYLANIINEGHTSIFGHAAVSFYVTGVSRSLTHELVRHRFLVFSQRSQRFVDESDCNFVCPPLLTDPAYASARELLEQSALQSRMAYRTIAESLILRGVPRKQAREAARAALPECTETRLLVSGNLRAWRDFIKLRNADGADAEIREFAQLILTQLRDRVAPNSVQDL